ncbi:MAG: hypothetical protein JJU00_02935 [Opitutales bacterium]|nr:hypothetical protein [Opitutales bacterium]
MPTYERFEDLPVWQTAIELAEGCEDFLIAAKEKITWSKRDDRTRAEFKRKDDAFEWERYAMSNLPPDHPMRQAWEKKHGPAK